MTRWIPTKGVLEAKRPRSAFVLGLAGICTVLLLLGFAAAGDAETVELQLANVDPDGTLLSGIYGHNEIWIRGDDLAGVWQDSPRVCSIVDGGTYEVIALWGGLNTGRIGPFRVERDTTTLVDPMAGRVTGSYSSPGQTRVLFVYEPIEVAVRIVDTAWLPLFGDSTHRCTIDARSSYHTFWRLESDAPATYVVARGSSVQFWGLWGGFATPWSDFVVVEEGMTYSYDSIAKTTIATVTPGRTEFLVVFEPIYYTLLNVDRGGYLLPNDGDHDGKVQAWTQSGWGWPSVGVSPYTFLLANGGSFRFGSWWDGFSGKTPFYRVYKDTTYLFETATGDMSITTTPGMNAVRFIWTTNLPPVAQAGADQTVEADMEGGASVLLDGSASSDDGVVEPLQYHWTWDGGEASEPVVEVFLPLGSTEVTLTVYDGELSHSDTTTIEVRDTTPPEIVCPPELVLDYDDPEKAEQYAAWLASVFAADVCDLAVEVTHDAPAFADLPVEGREGIGTEVAWTATDASGNSATCTRRVKLLDTTPPEFLLRLEPAILWPANHKLVTITAFVEVADNYDPNPATVLLCITSSEEDECIGCGDGHTGDDIQSAEVGILDLEFELRAERQGSDQGRIYTITYQACDCFGNCATAIAEVLVPHESPNSKKR